MQIAQLLRDGKEELEKNGVVDAELSAQILLGSCLKKGRTQLFLCAEEHVSPKEYERFMSFIKRRAKREPVAYILEEREFWSLPFFVNSNVLIPRPETEFLLEKVFSVLRQSKIKKHTVIDLCCGSGVIAVVLALELRAEVIAVDCSEQAIAVTRENCRRHGVEKMVSPVLSDLLSGLAPSGKYSLIVSNPPYVSCSEIASELEPEVARFEPHLALDGGNDGLDVVRSIADKILSYLIPAGMFFMEFGAAQAGDVKDIFSTVVSGNRFFEIVEIFQDYSGRDRVLYAQVNKYKE